ncbi:Fe-Mn family superoxide dismutase [Cladophialophora psammophila CBS 110553]|uniref:Superoxide dismutase n=1 Tax=Cladophialophora psammophila CBS 110553 TaxID=1182543 RepID=W9WZA6_9EURO|nr:Fe-Mn family superoxide dismutase [Cladophialophora psammophila CBS 110553]EXJ70006.1 Fe-Mn family superoxide dismutase [Cladophialophora psammophila CBS 110553]
MPVTYDLPQLPYSLDALEPSISGQIMDLHYNRHHRTYITNLNAALGAQAEATSSNNRVKQLELQAAINFNAGGHINHTLFWESLAPASSGNNNLSAVAPTLSDAITKRWGSFDSFQAAFESSALAIQGSGWQWLVQDPQTKGLELTTSKDQDLPKGGKGIVLGVDMWEHAYYIQYFNNKKEYLTRIWDVINWQTAEKRYKGDPRAAFGSLAGLAGHL